MPKKKPTPQGIRLRMFDEIGVVSSPYAVQHLADHGFLKLVEEIFDYGDVGNSTRIDALYRITPSGRALAIQWPLSPPAAQ